MKDLVKRLMEDGEYFAAGLMETETRSPLIRFSTAILRYYENAVLPDYTGGRLYPNGSYAKNMRFARLIPSYPYTASLSETDAQSMRDSYGEAIEPLISLLEKVKMAGGVHTVGGDGWTHSFINYPRIMKEGIGEYGRRVEALPEGEFREAMQLTVRALDVFFTRSIDLLKKEKGNAALISALEWVQKEPPRSMTEALVLWNFVYYFDTCDDIGRLDQDLYPFYDGGDYTELIRELFTNVNANNGWSTALGPNYNELTVQVLRAARNMRRPDLQLRVTKDMPDEIWAEAAETLASGSGQPALYHEELFQKALEDIPEIRAEDREKLSFGGCTETMIEGCSNVGSDDAGIHVAWIFSNCMREKMAECASFEDFYALLCEQIRVETAEHLEKVNEFKRTRAAYRPNPIRTLLIDDCLDTQTEYNNGGARYIWGESNICGMITTIDSLLVIRTLIYEQKKYSAAEFIEKLDARDPIFLAEAKKCPRYGVDDDRADSLAADFFDHVCDAIRAIPCWPRGRYFPVSNQFTTYDYAGRSVKATPDGRADGEPLNDSMSAISGKDNRGPTAMLSSVAKMPLVKILGTPVTNLRVRKEHIRSLLKPLVKAYFEKGGMQLQISCVSREEMEDALVHPEKHEDLIVRIGGYCEYFNSLSPRLKKTVMDRTEY